MNNIRYYRKKNNLSLSKLAELVGLSPSTISNIENGKTIPKIEWIGKIANVLGCSIGELSGEAIYTLDINEHERIYFEPYYKLHYSFFKSRQYHAFMRGFGAAREMLAFLIMQAYSAKNKGVIKYEHTENMSIIEELALDTDCDIDVAESALLWAERVGLIEMTEEQIVFLDVQKQFNRKQNE